MPVLDVRHPYETTADVLLAGMPRFVVTEYIATLARSGKHGRRSNAASVVQVETGVARKVKSSSLRAAPSAREAAHETHTVIVGDASLDRHPEGGSKTARAHGRHLDVDTGTIPGAETAAGVPPALTAMSLVVPPLDVAETTTIGTTGGGGTTTTGIEGLSARVLGTTTGPSRWTLTGTCLVAVIEPAIRKKVGEGSGVGAECGSAPGIVATATGSGCANGLGLHSGGDETIVTASVKRILGVKGRGIEVKSIGRGEGAKERSEYRAVPWLWHGKVGDLSGVTFDFVVFVLRFSR